MKTVTPEDQVRWNAIITDVMRVFIQLCEEHKLTYFCGGGTAIGAVRHQGIIPWDDDIDVFMPRPDYDRFLEVAQRLPEGYELVTPYNTDNYSTYFAKLCNSRTTLVEEADTPCVIGLFIDVFPLDGTAADISEAVRLKRRFRKLQNRLEAVSTHSRFTEYVSLLLEPRSWGRFVTKTVAFCCRNRVRRLLLRRMERICARYSYEDAENVVVYSGVYDRREIYPKSWVSGTVHFAFEGLTVNLSSGYDSYLRQFFGDYMQLPPKEKRVSHHTKAYYNLDEREPVAQVMRKLGR